MINREYKRLQIQREFDNTTSLKKRNEMGQYATPYRLCEQIVHYIFENYLRNMGDGEIKILEPAIGTGAFFSALNNEKQDTKLSTCGIEKDKEVFQKAQEIWKNDSLELINKDFFDYYLESNEKFDCVITNPPYVRHHHFGKEQKSILKDMVKNEIGLEVSGLMGLYCYFILLSNKFIKRNGIGVWLIPSEYLEVNYGEIVKRYLKSNVTVTRIHKYNADNQLFDDANVSSSVLIYKMRTPDDTDLVEFTTGDDINNPEFKKMVRYNELNSEEKWTKFFKKNIVIRPKSILSDYFIVKRGIATGNNKYFVLDDEVIKSRNLPYECFTPLIPPIKELESTIIESIKGIPNVKKKYFVLDTDLPISKIQIKYPNLYEYLQDGIKNNVLDGYLVKSRKIWYKQESRKPAPFYCTYMSRRNGDKLFTFIRNMSDAIATNTYLMLYPTQRLQILIDNNLINYNDIFDLLSNLSTEYLENESRSYGNGLKKLEPKELGNVNADCFEKLEQLVSIKVV